MKEITECTAEVFRRSEKRIKERKRNRNRILTLCIPLCIVASIWSIMILPAMMPAGNKEMPAEENLEIAEGDGAAGSIACSFIQVEIQDVRDFSEHYELVTDKLEVDKMYFWIYDSFKNTAAEGVPDADGDSSTEDGSAAKTTAYIFTFTTAEGSEATYSLSGNKLAENETGETVYLNTDQLAELQKVFRLPN